MKTASYNRFPRARRTAYGLLLGAFALLCGTAAAQAGTDEDGQGASEEVDEVVVVTGTRLQGGDATARVDVITAEDIRAQGLTTFEDVIRSIPQNFATINTAKNLVTNGDAALDENIGALGLGTATANLRGFGSKHTLVLLNGKRLAGISSGDGQLAANLNDIPVAAIERIDVSHDGGSAVYGSDAVAGVINVITKRDYTGLTVGGKLENSSTGGDGRSMYVYAGTGWGAGSASAHVSLNQSDPMETAKTGWTTRDYSGNYGGDQRYNFVSRFYPRSGAVRLSEWDAEAALILPPGNDGRNAQPDDFVQPQPSDFIDVFDKYLGGSVDARSLTASVNQRLGAREQVELRADVLYSQTETASKVSSFVVDRIPVPASNAFNNFGHEVWLDYYADTEVMSGLLPQVEQTDKQQQLRYVLTASYKFNERFRVEVDYVKSESKSQGDQYLFAPPSPSRDDPALFQRLTELMSSSDPSVALNLFGDGTGQNASIAEFFRSWENVRDDTHTQTIEPKLYGNVWDLPGGPIDFVFGAEVRTEWVESPSEDPTFRGSKAVRIGTGRPTQDLTAYFLEASAPVVGDANGRPLLRRLVLSAQARYDEYRVEGSVENDENGRPILTEAKYSNSVTRIAAAWDPSDTVVVRVSRSEAFKTPSVSDLFSGTNVRYDGIIVFDPLKQPPWVPGNLVFGPNPNLRPESSINWTIGLDWTPQAVEGLQLKIGWSRIELENKIASSSELQNLLPPEVYGNLPEFFVRNENGDLIDAINRSINISQRFDERLDLEVEYSIDTSLGTLRPRLAYFRVLDRFDVAVPGGSKSRQIGKSVGFDKYTIRANLAWLYGPFTADLWIRHTPGYINNDKAARVVPLPDEPVGSYTTTDLTAAYELDSGWVFRAGGRNILDRDPPYMLSGDAAPYDLRRIDPSGRVLFVEVNYSLTRY